MLLTVSALMSMAMMLNVDVVAAYCALVASIGDGETIVEVAFLVVVVVVMTMCVSLLCFVVVVVVVVDAEAFDVIVDCVVVTINANKFADSNDVVNAD